MRAYDDSRSRAIGRNSRGPNHPNGKTEKPLWQTELRYIFTITESELRDLVFLEPSARLHGRRKLLPGTRAFDRTAREKSNRCDNALKKKQKKKRKRMMRWIIDPLSTAININNGLADKHLLASFEASKNLSVTHYGQPVSQGCGHCFPNLKSQLLISFHHLKVGCKSHAIRWVQHGSQYLCLQTYANNAKKKGLITWVIFGEVVELPFTLNGLREWFDHLNQSAVRSD